MQKTIQTTRFGQVNFQSDYVLRFRDGMVGFPDLKEYVLVESPQMPLVLWLQSTEESNVAFPLIEPEILGINFKYSMNTADEAMIFAQKDSKLKLFVVLTIPQNVQNMTANLRAPIVFNISESSGGQIILQDKALSLRESVFEKFQVAMNKLAAFELVDSEQPKWVAHNWREAAEKESTFQASTVQ